MRIFKTLERLDTSTPKSAFASHLARYAYARERIPQSSRVLDLGCGIGYGSHYICESTSGVVALDVSSDAIRMAKSNYSHPKIFFLLSQGQKLPFRAASFDVILSFEVIEHLRPQDQTEYVCEIRRVLKPKGSLFVSTPNRKFTAGVANPYHFKEFYIDELKEFLSRYFPIVELHGQYCVSPAANIYNGAIALIVNKLKEVLRIQFLLPDWGKRMMEFFLTGSTMAKVGLQDYRFVDQQIEDCPDFLAVCTNGD